MWSREILNTASGKIQQLDLFSAVLPQNLASSLIGDLVYILSPYLWIMVQNSALTSLTDAQIAHALGTSLAQIDLAQLQASCQLLTIPPGTNFWRTADGNAGIYIVRSGKVRLFNSQDKRVATLTIGKSFGASTLFTTTDFSPYTAKSALVVGAIDISICYIPSAAIEAVWTKYPQIQTHLHDRAEHLEEVICGIAEPSALYLDPQGLQPRAVAIDRQILPPAPVTSNTAPKDRFKQAHFPTPTQQMWQWWRKTTHKYPFYAQHSAADCCAACVVMVGRYWGKEFNINRLRELAHVSRDGASLKGLATATESLGFNSRPVKATLDRLAQQQLPAIAHWQGKHYIVVFEIAPKYVIVCDPAIGQIKLTHAEFIPGWTGCILLVEPTLSLQQQDDGKSTNIWQLFQLIKPHKVVIAEIAIALIVLQIFGSIAPIFTQLILDRAVVHRSASSLTTFGVGLLIFGGFQIVMTALRQYLMASTANRLDAALVIGFIRHTFSLPLSYFDSRHVGDIISRVQENHKIQSFITGESLGVLLDLFSMFLYATLMFLYSWKLKLVTLILTPFL